MTTLTKKKNYTTPRCVFVALEEETNLLSGSIVKPEETPSGTQEKYVFGIMQTDYNEIQIGSNNIWGD